MSARCQIVAPDGSDPRSSDPRSRLAESQQLAALLAQNGQLILPLLDLVEQVQCAIDDLFDVMSRATIEAVQQLSAQQLAGPRQQDKTSDRDVVYHGSQPGRVKLNRLGLPSMLRRCLGTTNMIDNS